MSLSEETLDLFCTVSTGNQQITLPAVPVSAQIRRTGRAFHHDFHATLLNGLGLDHKRLTYRYTDRDFRLTDVFGNVQQKLQV